jgi:hypothetical protein
MSTLSMIAEEPSLARQISEVIAMIFPNAEFS